MKLVYCILICFAAFLLQVCHVDCNCEYVNQPSGVISYVSQYRNMRNFRKCWQIDTPDESFVELTFLDLNLNDPYCDSAFLELSDDTGREEKICRYDYGRSLNWINQTKTAVGAVNITLVLHSTWDYVSIRLSYKIESTACVKQNHFRCSDTQCVRSDQVCDGSEDCENGLDESNCGIVAVKGAEASRMNAIHWLKNHEKNFGWGRNTHRAVTALYLTDAARFRGKKLDEEVIIKQLQLKTATTMLRNLTDPMSVNELSMYVNALSVTCHNIRNLFSNDLLKILASRALSTSSTPSPGAYLTLCNANWPISRQNVNQLLNLLSKNIEYPFAFEIQAMTIMALSCIREKTNFFNHIYNASDIYNDTLENFISNQKIDGSFGNAHTTAMVVQALISSGQTHKSQWPLDKAVKFLIRSLNSSSIDFLSVYLTLPLFKSKTLTDIGRVDCSGYERKLEDDEDILDVAERLGGTVHVQYSLYIGDHKNVIHKLFLTVPENSTVLDVMRVAEIADKKYKFSYNEANGHVYIYELAGLTNDMEAGKFWFVFTESGSNMTYDATSPDQIVVKNKEHLIMWYKTVNI